MASSTSLDHAYNTIILAAATRGQDFIGDRRANECQAVLAGARVALGCLPAMAGGRSGEASALAIMLEDGLALGEAIELAKDLRKAQQAGYDLSQDERLQKANDIAARVRAQQEFNKTVAAARAGKPATYWITGDDGVERKMNPIHGPGHGGNRWEADLGNGTTGQWFSISGAKAQPVEHGSLRDIAQITLAVILISAAYLGPIIAFGG